jgi:fatty-acyl-CoA synthase
MDAWLPTPCASLTAAGALLRSGLVRPYRPDHLARMGRGAARYGFGPAFGPLIGDIRCPDAPAMVDDDGSVTMRELEARCSAVAQGLFSAGLTAGDTLGVLARNGAAFYEVVVGASRLGVDVVYLNSGFSAGQVAETVGRRGLRALVYDLEFAGLVPGGVLGVPTSRDPAGLSADVATMAGAMPYRAATPDRPSRHILLTSGTTGEPKGVARTGGGVASAMALLSGFPLRVRETHLIAAPMFHGWGWLHMLLSMLLSSTVVVTRRFDPERILALVERERCHVLVAVPTMLQKIMDLPPLVRRRYDTTSLRVVAVSGAALSPRLAEALEREFGEVVYSLYGTTEAGFATVATPTDLRAAAGTAGRPLATVHVRVVDDQGRRCPPGVPGVIYVGGRDAVPDNGPGAVGAVRTGDVGWFDRAGRLFVGGREDEMVVVGGENVYPVLVENLLESNPDIAAAAVVGEPDRVLGEVLVAHVVLRNGSTVSPAAIRGWCRSRLAPFQVPRRVVVHDRLPRNEIGKVVKRAFRKVRPPKD